MASANLTVGIKGVDQTGAAFKSIGWRAKATGAQIRKMMGGALAAAGAYVGFSAIKGGIENLGKMSDLAMKSGASVDELTRAATAFQVAGLDVSVDTLAKSFQYLKKNTGKSGMGAFWDAVTAISKIEDPAKRGAELVKNFGRSGLELQTLVNGGEEAIQKFKDLQSLMPGLSAGAANVGDEFADAMTIISNGTKSILQTALAKLLSYFSEGFPGGVRAGALNAMNWLETFFRKAHAWIAKLGTRFMSFGALIGDVFTMGPEAAWKLYLDTNAAADRDFANRISEAERRREEYVEKLKGFDVDDLAGAFEKSSKVLTSGQEQTSSGKMSKQIRNDLILGGTNEARKIAAFGPQYQNEAKKQTNILKKIEENTASTADNTEGSGEEFGGV